MINRITVRDVIERHDCAGKKFIDITSMEEDELTASRFRLTSVQMPPWEKLLLSTVSPMDEALVSIDSCFDNPLILGEYVNVLEDLHNREARCRCGTMLVSDGFDIYCPSNDCGLTLLARIERLAQTQFFCPNIDGSGFMGDVDCLVLANNPHYTQPFAPILQPRLWGESIGTLEHALLRKRPCHISLATFLVEGLFREFLDCVSPMVNFDQLQFHNLANFYGAMEEMTQRRDYNSHAQNKLIKEFIWSLGIESLHEDVIDRLVTYEQSTGWCDDVMIPYAFMLSRPHELSRELGVHPLEALSISAEFRRRKFEMADIFVNYSTPELHKDVFANLR